jgi:hypothetical protein
MNDISHGQIFEEGYGRTERKQVVHIYNTTRERVKFIKNITIYFPLLSLLCLRLMTSAYLFFCLYDLTTPFVTKDRSLFIPYKCLSLLSINWLH